MSATINTNRLPSKAAQMEVDRATLWVRCEDGSIWYADTYASVREWYPFEPPHSPPTQQPSPIIEMPEPLMDRGNVVFECREANRRAIQSFKGQVFGHYAYERDWLKQALAWCEQEDKP